MMGISNNGHFQITDLIKIIEFKKARMVSRFFVGAHQTPLLFDTKHLDKSLDKDKSKTL
jgi:hypothetical protein